VKKILSFICLLFLIKTAFAQSVDIGTGYISIKTNNNYALSFYKINNGGTQNPSAISFGSFDNGNYFTHGAISVKPFEFAQSINGFGSFKFSTGFGESMNITYNNVTHNVFTKLGADAPAIKIKKLAGTTRSTEGTQVTLNHGLQESKILSISVMVDTETNDFIHPSYRSAPGYEFEWFLFDGSIYVKNVSGNSSNILSKPIKILITYEE
jgi:hypothetical protein